MDNYKTIKELADEIDYSKQSIQKVIEGLPFDEKPNKRGNKYILSEDDQVRIIKKLGLDNSDKKSNILDNDLDSLNIKSDKIDKSDNKMDNSDKNGYIEFLKVENSNKILRIEKLEKLLDQQQQLTLQANKQIEQLQSQLLLTNTTNQEEDSWEEDTKKKILKKEVPSKKWFQFWR